MAQAIVISSLLSKFLLFELNEIVAALSYLLSPDRPQPPDSTNFLPSVWQ